MALNTHSLSAPRLTLNLLTTTRVAPPSNASKWQVGFNSAFKELNKDYSHTSTLPLDLHDLLQAESYLHLYYTVLIFTELTTAQ